MVLHRKKSLGRTITKSDLRKYSEFNTYMIKGLPANQIFNPEEDTLKATVKSANSKFYYFD